MIKDLIVIRAREGKSDKTRKSLSVRMAKVLGKSIRAKLDKVKL